MKNHRDIPSGWTFLAGNGSVRVLSRKSEIIPTHMLFLLQRRCLFFWWATIESFVLDLKQ